MTTDKPSERGLTAARALTRDEHVAQRIAIALDRFAAEEREAESRACEALDEKDTEIAMLKTERDRLREQNHAAASKRDRETAADRKRLFEFQALYDEATKLHAAEMIRIGEHEQCHISQYGKGVLMLLLEQKAAQAAEIERLKAVRPAALSMLDEILALPHIEQPGPGENVAGVVCDALEYLESRAADAERERDVLRTSHAELLAAVQVAYAECPKVGLAALIARANALL